MTLLVRTLMNACEINFDGIVGPTHHYGGLGVGNLASQRHRHEPSNPRAAALQGLAKMQHLMELGVQQAVLPPHERPDMAALRQVGFTGTDAQVLATAHREAPDLLAACASTSAMWAANAATVSPGADTTDGRVHLTPANLVTQWHRALEAPTTTLVLRRIFHDSDRFVVHDPLPAAMVFADEGAANHMRLTRRHGEAGIEVFTFGRDNLPAAPDPRRFPARQSFDASQAVARLHSLPPDRTVFLRQSDAAIDAGVFHNDVIAVGNERVLLYHEQAYADGVGVIDAMGRAFATNCHTELVTLPVCASEVSLAEAVETYLFNSQLVTLPSGDMALICPVECREHAGVRACLARLVDEDNPITTVQFVEVRQSMRNGGGPACLRLRVVLAADELDAMHQPVRLTEALLATLRQWVHRHYRDHLTLDDLADPDLLNESRAALDELSRMLQLGAIYPFQR